MGMRMERVWGPAPVHMWGHLGTRQGGTEMELGTQQGQDWGWGWRDRSGDRGWHGDRDRVVLGQGWEWGWHKDGDRVTSAEGWGQGWGMARAWGQHRQGNRVDTGMGTVMT